MDGEEAMPITLSLRPNTNANRPMPMTLGQQPSANASVSLFH